MDIVIRAIVLFSFMFLLTRVIGRRELSSLEPFDLILLIVLGDSIQQGLTQDDYSMTVRASAVGAGGARTAGARAADPATRRRAVGGLRAERDDQLHPEEVASGRAAVP